MPQRPFGLEGPWDLQASRPAAATDAEGTRLLLAVTVVACIGGAWALSRSPTLRRLTWRLARAALTTYLPAYLGHEFQAAWRATSPKADTLG